MESPQREAGEAPIGIAFMRALRAVAVSKSLPRAIPLSEARMELERQRQLKALHDTEASD